VTSSWFFILQLSQDARSNKHQIFILVLSAFWPRKAKLFSEAPACSKTCSTVKNDSYVLQYNRLRHVLPTFRFFIYKLVGFLVTCWVNLLMALILSIFIVLTFLHFMLTVHFLLYLASLD